MKRSIIAGVLAFATVGGCTKSSEPAPRATVNATTAPTTLPTTTPVATSTPLRTSPGPYRPFPNRLLTATDRTITVKPRFALPDQPPAGEQTYTLDPRRTQVFAHVVTNERQNEKGQIVQSTQLQPVPFTALMAGQMVNVSAGDDNVAIDVIIYPAPPRRPTTTTRPIRLRTTGRAPTTGVTR